MLSSRSAQNSNTLASHANRMVGSDNVTAVQHIKNLGVYLDSHLDMTTQVSRTISTCS